MKNQKNQFKFLDLRWTIKCFASRVTFISRRTKRFKFVKRAKSKNFLTLKHQQYLMGKCLKMLNWKNQFHQIDLRWLIKCFASRGTFISRHAEISTKRAKNRKFLTLNLYHSKPDAGNLWILNYQGWSIWPAILTKSSVIDQSKCVGGIYGEDRQKDSAGFEPATPRYLGECSNHWTNCPVIRTKSRIQIPRHQPFADPWQLGGWGRWEKIHALLAAGLGRRHVMTRYRLAHFWAKKQSMIFVFRL